MTLQDRPTFDAGAAYEPLTGRWSRQIAPQFLDWINASARGHWLDVGCGTGALIQSILDTQQPIEVVGIDPSSAYIAYARREIEDERVRLEVGSAEALPVASNQYDAVVSGLVLHDIPASARLDAVRESARVARSGGRVGAYVWDFAGGMELRVKFWEAASLEVNVPEEVDERTRYPICQPSPLATLFEKAGLFAVETTKLHTVARFERFEDYWSPFGTGDGGASQFLLAQSAETRSRIRDRLERSLTDPTDGAVMLSVEAWGVKGVK